MNSGAPAVDHEDHEVAEAVALAHRLAVLAETDPAAPLIVAVQAALDIAEARRAARRVHRLVALQIHGGDRAQWRRWAGQWVPADELARRRACPNSIVDDTSSGDRQGGGGAR